ncbi:MAG: multicopper oxidase family protein [Thermosynechococcaceae cyanobacterium]
MSPISRRQFLTLSTGTASAVFLSRCAMNPTSDAQTQNPIKLNPIASRGGLLDVSLEAQYGSTNLGNRQGYLMSYNGKIPGPRLEAKPGDTVRIRFTNRLQEPTNLHYHGLHIPATGNADNIFLHIAPGKTLTYEFTLPKNHPAGTFYYHPHLHESVAKQIFAGLGGIFVVRGALDDIPEIRAAQEEFLFLKDFALDSKGQIPSPNHMELMQGREGSIVTANGQVNPNLSIAKGGLLRLRLVNASTSRFYRLQLEEHPFFLIATDGGAIAEPIELRELLLSPGERAEVLIQGDRPPGQYRLLNLPYNRVGTGMMGMMGRGMGNMGGMGGMMHGGTGTQTPQAIATLTYQGSANQVLPLPQKLLDVETLPQPSKTRRIELSMKMGMGSGMEPGMGLAFLFNGKPFDPQRIDASVQLGSIEDWDLANVDPDGMEHPFHLHINSFQVVSRNGKPEPYRAWKDTVLVRANETVRIRIPFRDYAGKTVYHCHVLDHEDLGMMGIVEMKA